MTTVWDPARAAEIIAAHKNAPGATLPVLHAIQRAFGCIPEAAVPMVADALNLSRAEVHGVVTFYHDFRTAPPARTVVKLCRAEACQAMGCDGLADGLKRRYGVEWHGATADGRVALEPVFCLGLCSIAPAAIVGERLVGRADETRIAAAIDKSAA